MKWVLITIRKQVNKNSWLSVLFAEQLFNVTGKDMGYSYTINKLDNAQSLQQCNVTTYATLWLFIAVQATKLTI